MPRMILLALPAFAEGLPWECPAITVPADAVPYRDTDAEVSAVVSTIRDLVATWELYDCAWTEVGEGDGETYARTERACDDGRVGIEIVDEWDVLGGRSEERFSVTVRVASGEAYTELSYAELWGGSWDWDSSAASFETRVAWTGAVAGLPDDGWLSVLDGESEHERDWSESRAVETSACSWTWSFSGGGIYWREEETVTAPDRTVLVWTGEATRSGCDIDLPQAVVDGVTVGAVDGTTWERDPADMDGDGWPAGAQDCDDTDPARSECLAEILDDGVDQDCNGIDATTEDTDGDGHAAEAYGGDDCNDGWGFVHPGANDTAGDGVDADCDGGDDVDHDGDGYTTTGDDDPADCDDRSATVFPGGAEIACDGIDQDCDGVDVCDDTGREDTGPVDSGPVDSGGGDSAGEPDTGDTDTDRASVAPEEDTGCGSGAAAFLTFLPLLTLRRRR